MDKQSPISVNLWWKTSDLSDAGKRFAMNMDKDSFQEFSFNILDHVTQMDLGKSLEEFEKEADEYHEVILSKFLNYLKKKKKTVPKRSLEIYSEICGYFLGEISYTYGKKIDNLLEINLLDFLFDRFIRKSPFHNSMKKTALKAISVFYKFLYNTGIVEYQVYKFMTLLRKHQKFFDQRIDNSPASGFFWDVDEDWKEDLFKFKRDMLFMSFYIAPEDLEPLPYVGMLENMLTKKLEEDLNMIWRKAYNKSPKRLKIANLLFDYMNNWYEQPLEIINNQIPRDIILIERHFMNHD